MPGLHLLSHLQPPSQVLLGGTVLRWEGTVRRAGPPCYSNSLPPAGKETCRASLWPEGQTTRLNAVASVASFPFTSCPARWTVGVDLPMKQGPSLPYTQRKRAPQGGRGWQPTPTREPWAVSEEGRSGTVMCRHHLKNGAKAKVSVGMRGLRPHRGRGGLPGEINRHQRKGRLGPVTSQRP